MDKKKRGWVRIDGDNFVAVFRPIIAGDQKCHDFPGYNCPCRPKIVSGSSGFYYPKPVIVHNSFGDQERIDKSMAALAFVYGVK